MGGVILTDQTLWENVPGGVGWGGGEVILTIQIAPFSKIVNDVFRLCYTTCVHVHVGYI